MAITGLYEPENMKRVRLAQLAVTVLTVAVGGYIAATALFSVHQVWDAQQSLATAKTESAELSRQAAQERRNEMRRVKPEDGGVDAFAVVFAQWAKPRGIRVETFTPEGPPATAAVASDGAKLGVWNASKVRIKGRADYQQLMSLLDEFETTQVPVRLESFVFQSAQQTDKVGVTFDLLLTVYERVGEAGKGNAAG